MIRGKKQLRQEDEANIVKDRIIKRHQKAQDVLEEIDKTLSNGFTLKMYYSIGHKHGRH